MRFMSSVKSSVEFVTCHVGPSVCKLAEAIAKVGKFTRRTTNLPNTHVHTQRFEHGRKESSDKRQSSSNVVRPDRVPVRKNLG